MAVKVSVGEPNTQVAKEYPKLMKNQDGEIFYMVREGYGIPLTGEDWGYYQEDFADFSKSRYHIFTDYNGVITLKNK